MKRLAVVTCALLAWLTSVCVAGSYNVRETELGPWIPAAESFLTTPDGLHQAAVVVRGDKKVVVVDGKESPEYTWVGEMRFSADGNQFAYCAARGEGMFVVVDGKEGPVYDAVGLGYPIFSPDGKRVAFSARRGDKWLAVVDDQPGREYDMVLKDTPVFSQDSEHVFYGARRENKWIPVIDGQELAPCEHLGTTLVTKAGAFAYVLQRADKWRVAVGNQEYAGFDGVMVGNPVLSDDGKTVAYAAKRGNEWLFVVNGEAGPAWDGIVQGGPTFAPDGTVSALAHRGGKMYRVKYTLIR